jgi:hypothetical protein
MGLLLQAIYSDKTLFFIAHKRTTLRKSGFWHNKQHLKLKAFPSGFGIEWYRTTLFPACLKAPHTVAAAPHISLENAATEVFLICQKPLFLTGPK